MGGNLLVLLAEEDDDDDADDADDADEVVGAFLVVLLSVLFAE